MAKTIKVCGAADGIEMAGVGCGDGSLCAKNAKSKCARLIEHGTGSCIVNVRLNSYHRSIR